jgi:hypothetical protein
MTKKLVTVTLVLLLLISCSSNKGPVSGKNDDYWDPNLKNKIEKTRDEGGGIFGNIGKKDTNTSVDFAKSNVLWKATLKSLEFLPLINADYSGGIIIYDWYSIAEKPKEQIKVTVQFLDNELRTESIKILAHKKICENINNCSNSVIDENFSNSVKSSIISTARILKIEEAKKDKK